MSAKTQKAIAKREADKAKAAKKAAEEAKAEAEK